MINLSDVISTFLAVSGILISICIGAVIFPDFGSMLYHAFDQPLDNFLICLNCGQIIKIKRQLALKFPAVKGSAYALDYKWDYFLRPCCDKPARVNLERFQNLASLFLAFHPDMDYEKWSYQARERAMRKARRDKYDLHYRSLLDYGKLIAAAL